MSNKTKLLLCGAVLSLTSTGQAQESLLDIYERAIGNDPVIREQEAIYMRELQTKPLARSALLPSVQLSSSASHSDTQDPNPPTDFQTGQPSTVISSTESLSDSTGISLSLNQIIFDWGRYVSLRQADKVLTRAETDYEAAKQDLIIRVANAYFTVLAAEDTLASEVAAREALARQLEQAQRRFEVGLIAITDVQESQAGFDAAVAAEIAAQRNLATSRELLREIVGESIERLAAPREDMPLLTPEPANAEQWVRNALQSNLALVSSRISTDIAQDEIKVQRSVRLPTLNFQTAYTDRQSEAERTNNLFGGLSPIVTSSTTTSEGYSWSLSFAIPLYTGGLNRARIQQSVYSHRAALEQTERVARATEREARDAYLGVISEISRVRALAQALESARTALQATEAGFEVGTRTTVDVLTFQDNVRRAQTNYARSRYDYMIEVMRLQAAVGNLDAEVLQEIDSWLE